VVALVAGGASSCSAVSAHQGGGAPVRPAANRSSTRSPASVGPLVQPSPTSSHLVDHSAPRVATSGSPDLAVPACNLDLTRLLGDYVGTGEIEGSFAGYPWKQVVHTNFVATWNQNDRYWSVFAPGDNESNPAFMIFGGAPTRSVIRVLITQTQGSQRESYYADSPRPISWLDLRVGEIAKTVDRTGSYILVFAHPEATAWTVTAERRASGTSTSPTRISLSLSLLGSCASHDWSLVVAASGSDLQLHGRVDFRRPSAG